MSGFGTPPVIPEQLQLYNSYLIDPQWQVKFSIIWSSIVGFFVLLSLPRLARAFKRGRNIYGIKNWFWLRDAYNNDCNSIHAVEGTEGLDGVRRRQQFKMMGLAKLNAYSRLSIPKVGVSVAQITLLLTYLAVVILCIIKNSELIDNPNRPGFIALAQLPVVFLFATKNSVLSLLLGPDFGYEKLNFFHRWAGRVLFASAAVHGLLWIKDHVKYGSPILGQEKEASGLITFALLSMIVLVSLLPVRRFLYEAFFFLHLIFSLGFLAALCYHTPYALPWMFPPMAFYGLDMLLRMVRQRFMDGFLVPIGNQMTLVHIPHLTSGWLAGQHVRLRIFFSGRVFESHPLTIFTATPDVSCITSQPAGMSFGVRALGNWSSALNTYATGTPNGSPRVSGSKEITISPVQVPVQVLIDGPYGGCSIDLGDYETIVFVAGGSGVTFTLGVLDDIVGRCLRKGRKNGEKTRRIEFAWCIKSFGQLEWFASALTDISAVVSRPPMSTLPLDLHISIYVTCLCNPEAVPSIVNCDVMTFRPSIHQILLDVITPPISTAIPASQSASPLRDDQLKLSSGGPKKPALSDAGMAPQTEIIIVDEEKGLHLVDKLSWLPLGGGIAVCSSGPESLTTETANAVSRIQLGERGRDLGEIGLHTEIFSL